MIEDELQAVPVRSVQMLRIAWPCLGRTLLHMWLDEAGWMCLLMD